MKLKKKRNPTAIWPSALRGLDQPRQSGAYASLFSVGLKGTMFSKQTHMVPNIIHMADEQIFTFFMWNKDEQMLTCVGKVIYKSSTIRTKNLMIITLWRISLIQCVRYICVCMDAYILIQHKWMHIIFIEFYTCKVIKNWTFWLFLSVYAFVCISLRCRHNDQDGVSNHQPHGCLLNRLFRGRSNKTSKLRVTGLCVGNSPGPVNSPHKGPVTRKMFPFDDVIM